MKQFYEAYPDKDIVSALLTQIHWTHHMLILSKSRSFEERQFYLKLSVVEMFAGGLTKLFPQIMNRGFREPSIPLKDIGEHFEEFREIVLSLHES